jgi:hypothetical protein
VGGWCDDTIERVVDHWSKHTAAMAQLPQWFFDEFDFHHPCINFSETENPKQRST